MGNFFVFNFYFRVVEYLDAHIEITTRPIKRRYGVFFAGRPIKMKNQIDFCESCLS